MTGSCKKKIFSWTDESESKFVEQRATLKPCDAGHGKVMSTWEALTWSLEMEFEQTEITLTVPGLQAKMKRMLNGFQKDKFKRRTLRL